MNFRLVKNNSLELAKDAEILQADLDHEPDRKAAYRKAMLKRAELKSFTDLQLKHELELRGWNVLESDKSTEKS